MISRNNTERNNFIRSLTEDKEINNRTNLDNCNTQLKNTKKNSKALNNNISRNKINDTHPLDFYALGKVHDPPHYTSNLYPNNAFRSTSNDIISRNVFSLNTSKYDNLKAKKTNSGLSLQNIDENNYLKPIEVFKTYNKYSLPSNAVNMGTYNIAKEKIFTKSNISLIKKGMNITYSNFIDYKNKLLTENTPRNNNRTLKDKLTDKNLQRIKTENNYKLKNKSNDEIENKYKLEDINNKNEYINNKMNKPKIKYINPNDYSKKELSRNCFYFDKNNKQFMRHKNWWKPDK
jgi:hypothetical protein